DNESPNPADRVFFTWDYYNDLFKNFLGKDANLNRALFGFEKTFLDGNASFGMRVPLNITAASGTVPGTGIGDVEIGDLTLIGKYAFARDDESGSLLSAGLALTVPTNTGNLFGDTVLLEPYLGYSFIMGGHAFVQGFSSILIATDSTFATSWLN